MESKRTATTYFIPPGKFLLMENALGNPDLIQSSVSSDCRVTIVDLENFPLDELEQWPTFRLTSADIKLNLGSAAYYIYIVVPSPDNAETTTAFVSYHTSLVDRDGFEVLETTDEEGNAVQTKGDLLGKEGYKYYQCGTVSARGENSSANTTPSGQGRLIEVDLGVTPAPSTLPGDLTDFDKIFQIDKVDPYNPKSWLLTVLTMIKEMTARLVRVTGSLVFGSGEDERAVTSVATSADIENKEAINDATLATTAWVNSHIEVIDKKYLRKDQDDETPYTLGVNELRTLDAVWSFLTGKGTLIKDGLIQTDRIEVRQSMTVMDLIINQLQGIAADFLFSDVGKVDTVTEIAERTYLLHIEKKTEFDFTTLGENDVLQMIVNDLYKGGGNYFSSWMRVLSVDTDANEVMVVLYDDAEVPGGANFAPVEGYNVARKGNAVVPDTEAGETNARANYWMLSSREGRIQFLQNVFKPMLEDYNYALSLGKIPDIEAIKHLPVTPNKDVGLVAQTAIVEKLYEFDYNGDIKTRIVDRGDWSLETAQGDSPYRNVTSKDFYPDGDSFMLLEQHTVWHNGCRWGCLKDKTTAEPKWNSTDWSLLEGNTELEMRFMSSEGNAFAAGKVDTYITPSVYMGNIDISDDIAAIDWIWTYELGEYNGRVLHLTNELMPANWSRANKAKFTCTAYVRKSEDDVTPVSNVVTI